MKKKQKQVVNETNCMSQMPAWRVAKTKQESWNKGFDSGYQEACRVKQQDFNEINIKNDTEAKKIKLEALNKLTNSMDQFMDAVSHAIIKLI